MALKAQWNAVSVEEVKLGSTTLDTVCWYGRSVADLDLLSDAFDLQDDAPHGIARIAIHPTPHTMKVASRDALEGAADCLSRAGAEIVRLDLAEVITRWMECGRSSLAAKAGRLCSILRGCIRRCRTNPF